MQASDSSDGLTKVIFIKHTEDNILLNNKKMFYENRGGNKEVGELFQTQILYLHVYLCCRTKHL